MAWLMLHRLRRLAEADRAARVGRLGSAETQCISVDVLHNGAAASAVNKDIFGSIVRIWTPDRLDRYSCRCDILEHTDDDMASGAEQDQEE